MRLNYDLTLRETANILGLSFDTNLRNSHAVTLAKRKIRSKKFGQQWMVCGKDVEKWLAVKK